MKLKSGGVAALACGIALVVPSTAAAECNTLISCTVEDVNNTVAETKAFVDAKVEETKGIAWATLDTALRTVNGAVADAQLRANAGAHTCVIQARVKPDGSGTGVADCVRRLAMTNEVTRIHGRVVLTGARVVSSPNGPKLTFAGSTLPIQIYPDDGSGRYEVTRLDDRASVGGISVHVGEYNGAGPARTAAAAFHTLADGSSGDHFINGALVLEGAV